MQWDKDVKIRMVGQERERELTVDQIVGRWSTVTSLFLLCQVRQHQYWGEQVKEADWERATRNLKRCFEAEHTLISQKGSPNSWESESGVDLLFQGKPPEEQVFRCMGALSKFCSINREVKITIIFNLPTTCQELSYQILKALWESWQWLSSKGVIKCNNIKITIISYQ